MTLCWCTNALHSLPHCYFINSSYKLDRTNLGRESFSISMKILFWARSKVLIDGSTRFFMVTDLVKWSIFTWEEGDRVDSCRNYIGHISQKSSDVPTIYFTWGICQNASLMEKKLKLIAIPYVKPTAKKYPLINYSWNKYIFNIYNKKSNKKHLIHINRFLLEMLKTWSQLSSNLTIGFMIHP